MALGCRAIAVVRTQHCHSEHGILLIRLLLKMHFESFFFARMFRLRYIWAIEWRLKRHVHIQSDEITRIIFVTCESTLPAQNNGTQNYCMEWNTFKRCDCLSLLFRGRASLKWIRRDKYTVGCQSARSELKLQKNNNNKLFCVRNARKNKMYEEHKIVVRAPSCAQRKKMILNWRRKNQDWKSSYVSPRTASTLKWNSVICCIRQINTIYVCCVHLASPSSLSLPLPLSFHHLIGICIRFPFVHCTQWINS